MHQDASPCFRIFCQSAQPKCPEKYELERRYELPELCDAQPMQEPLVDVALPVLAQLNCFPKVWTQLASWFCLRWWPLISLYVLAQPN